MEYVTQPDDISCGPTAIMNALKWAGVAVTGKDFDLFKFSCRTIDPEFPKDWDASGTTDSDLDRVLRYAGKGKFKVQRTRRPSIPGIIRHLKEGGAIVISYFWEESSQSGHHFAFISGMKRGCFEVVNDHAGDHMLRKDSTLRKWLKRRNESPICWFIKMTG